MAWISVHEDILGGKMRELSKSIGCSQNETVGILIRLWLWGINNADKEGRIIGANADDVAEILAIGKDKGIEADSIVDYLIECDWIEVVDDTLYIHDWEEWQEPLYAFKERRERDRQRKRAERAKAKDNPKPTPKPEQKDEKQSEEKTEKKSSGYTKDFEEFWQIYPRKVGKGEAYKKYKARLNDGFSEAELLEAATNYARKCASEHTEEKYIKHGKTFLSETTPFMDYISSRQEAKATAYPTGYQDDGSNPYR